MAQNLHMHCLYDDGRDTCIDMLLAAKRQGLTSAGISLHSPLPFQNDWAAAPEAEEAFLEEMDYIAWGVGQNQVFTGLEWDVLSDTAGQDRYQYVIGSVHHLPSREVPLSIDNTPEETRQVVEEDFGGDADAAAECYFREMQKIAENPRVDIVGHFDVLTKFQEKDPIFHVESTRYLKAASNALKMLVEADKLFEINTGAMAKGWRTQPYPDRRWIEMLSKLGGRVVLSSDAHRAEHVCYGFEPARKLLRECGFSHVQELTRLSDGKCVFKAVPL